MCWFLPVLTATAIIGQGSGKNEIKAFKLAADSLGDDPVDCRVEWLAGLVAAEHAQALNKRGV
jgi:hypothetical protein